MKVGGRTDGRATEADVASRRIAPDYNRPLAETTLHSDSGMMLHSLHFSFPCSVRMANNASSGICLLLFHFRCGLTLTIYQAIFIMIITPRLSHKTRNIEMAVAAIVQKTFHATLRLRTSKIF